jgi:nitrate reductase gamma subunit
MNETDLLHWARGPGLEYASMIFVFGMILRLIEIFMLGRKNNLAELRSNGIAAGIRTIFSRSVPSDKNTFRRSIYTLVAGYVFHIGLFVALFLLAPHIQIFKSIFGLVWPALPTTVVDFFVVLSLISLLAILWHRLTHPVIRFLSTGQDYLVWALTFLPLLTGYMSYHHLFISYTTMLALHILSVELLLVVFPFSKLTHAFTLFISRYYNGMMAGQKGVRQ